MLDVFYKAQECIEHSMSEFQINQFVIEDHITQYRKVKQIVIELRSRLENKAMAEFDLREIELEAERLQHKLENSVYDDEFARRKDEINLERQQYQVDRKQAQLQLHEREIGVFTKAFEKIVDEMGGEELFLEKITDNNYRDVEEQNYWTAKLSRSLQGDLISTGVISRGIFETIVNLPKEQQKLIYENAIKGQIALGQQLDDQKDSLLVESD